MRSSKRFIQVVLIGAGAVGALGCSDQGASLSDVGEDQTALGQNLADEVEPNANSAQATPIGNDVVVRANVVPDADADFYRFRVEAGSRVYAATSTAFSSATEFYTGVDDGDSILDLIGVNGTSVIQSDDDHGFMGELASSIAGAPIAAAGNYFLRVREFQSGAQLRPYDLHLRVREGSPTSETEPNNTVAMPQALPPSGWVNGTTATAADMDVFSLVLAAGDTIFASLDLDPERDASDWDGVLEFGQFAGTFFAVNDETSDATVSEALFATVKSAGTYYVRVSSAGVGEFGNYQLSVSVHPATQVGVSCTTYTSTDVPKAIPDEGRATSTITVPGTPRIEDLDLSIQLSHDFPEDVDVHLRSPAGNDIAIFTNVDSASTDIDLRIDDEAAFPLSQGDDIYFNWVGSTALNGLSVQPETTNAEYFSSGSRLHWFDGENASGVWTLVVDDDAVGDEGNLTGWALTVCQPPARVCPNGMASVNALSANFDTAVQGFTTSGAGWARGLPSGPPGFTGCNGGSTGCWKTNLTGPYASNANTNLVSPNIDLTNAVAPVTLSWAMKYQLESANYDHAWVEIRDMAAAGPRRVWEFLDSTMFEEVGAASEALQETAGWGIKTIDLSAFVGRTIQVAFHLDADSSVQLGGFAVDDFAVAHCGCGDKAIGPGEQCDLGSENGQSGSCCTATCQFVTNGSRCDDASACTNAEVCTSGVCGGGTPVVCDDMNVCTDNSCNPVSGCAYSNNTGPCPNGMCQGGMCQTGGMGGMSGGGAGGNGAAGMSGSGGNAGMGGTAGNAAAGMGGTAGSAAGMGGTAGSAAGMGGTAGSSPGGANMGGSAGSGGSAAGAGGVGGMATGGGGASQAGSGGVSQGGVGALGGNAGTPPGGDAGEGGAAGAPEGGTGASAGEGGDATGGSAPQGGSATGGRSGAGPTSGATGDPGGEGGEGTTGRRRPRINTDSSCACRVPGKSKHGELPVLLALLLGLAALKRRRNA